jgi:cell wall-associated NlpC family hydrolase
VNPAGLPPGINNADPNACPQDAQIPAGTFRFGGSARDLCMRSVLQARSTAAAKAIIWTFHHLGRPYQRPDRGGSCNGSRVGPGYDCSGFLTSAYEETGTPVNGNPTTAIMRTNWPASQRISAMEARPGDLLLPSTGHVVMLLADGAIIHTNKCGDVSHVRNRYNGDFMLYLAIRA